MVIGGAGPFGGNHQRAERHVGGAALAELRALGGFEFPGHHLTAGAAGDFGHVAGGGGIADAEFLFRVEGRVVRADAQAGGVDLAEAKRSPDQSARLRDILAVTGVAEKQLVSHLAWGTFHFQDVVHKRLGGRNPFDNAKTVYHGSHDDTALNAGVERFTADPAAVAALAYDADLSGLIVLPTVTVHARHDPTVSYQADAAYAATVDAAGRGHLLLQALTDERDHSRLQDATYLTALQVLETWLDSSVRPPADAFRETCGRLSQTRDACRFIAP